MRILISFFPFRYVDLGLGTHRVKCSVHQNFRMIVVAEDNAVWETFPIPLINRLEKHFLAISTMLDDVQVSIVDELKKWTANFAEVKFQVYMKMKQFTPHDVFVGFHDDVLASIVLKLSESFDDPDDSRLEIIELAKQKLLNCAAPDAIARLSETRLSPIEQESLCLKYYDNHYPTLAHAVQSAMTSGEMSLLFVTTHSKLLTKEGKDGLERSLKMPVKIVPLQQMKTQAQFDDHVTSFLEVEGQKVLLIQYQMLVNDNGALVDCARYVLQDNLSKVGGEHEFCVAFVLQVRLPFYDFSGQHNICD